LNKIDVLDVIELDIMQLIAMQKKIFMEILLKMKVITMMRTRARRMTMMN
jgi:hypothetical protein